MILCHSFAINVFILKLTKNKRLQSKWKVSFIFEYRVFCHVAYYMKNKLCNYSLMELTASVSLHPVSAFPCSGEFYFNKENLINFYTYVIFNYILNFYLKYILLIMYTLLLKVIINLMKVYILLWLCIERNSLKYNVPVYLLRKYYYKK